VVYHVSVGMEASGLSLQIDPANPRHFVGVLSGPMGVYSESYQQNNHFQIISSPLSSDTPYSGGVFEVDINIPMGQ